MFGRVPFGETKELAVFVDDAAARHHVEEVLDVVADCVVGREDAEVGVDLGGAGVVVAGAHVYVAAQAPGSRRTTRQSLAWILRPAKP